MTFARSNRSTLRFAGGALVVAALLLGLDAWALAAGRLAVAVLLGPLALISVGVVVRVALRLRRWPASRLGFFRDRLVLLGRRGRLQIRWDEVEGATLADQGDWAMGRWPEVRLTQRLTIRLRGDRRVSFRPMAYGLEPGACRDLILRLRDDHALRGRLPEFESIAAVLARSPRTGELIDPRL
ncbi:MAG TPA: hypothetical protein VKY90_20690 [Candidatus Dormibacteraeota bacterium]|nr:hypothetical protein [Candidatus Dormibacteraeota bacterium]